MTMLDSMSPENRERILRKFREKIEDKIARDLAEGPYEPRNPGTAGGGLAPKGPGQ